MTFLKENELVLKVCLQLQGLWSFHLLSLKDRNESLLECFSFFL